VFFSADYLRFLTGFFCIKTPDFFSIKIYPCYNLKFEKFEKTI